jgi:hypothetical protein
MTPNLSYDVTFQPSTNGSLRKIGTLTKHGKSQEVFVPTSPGAHRRGVSALYALAFKEALQKLAERVQL